MRCLRYKANRPKMDVELAEQIPYIHRLVAAWDSTTAYRGAEADDIIGTLAYRAVAEGHHVVISTGDKDMMQLINDCVILKTVLRAKLLMVQAWSKNSGLSRIR